MKKEEERGCRKKEMEREDVGRKRGVGRKRRVREKRTRQHIGVEKNEKLKITQTYWSVAEIISEILDSKINI